MFLLGPRKRENPATRVVGPGYDAAEACYRIPATTDASHPAARTEPQSETDDDDDETRNMQPY